MAEIHVIPTVSVFMAQSISMSTDINKLNGIFIFLNKVVYKDHTNSIISRNIIIKY